MGKRQKPHKATRADARHEAAHAVVAARLGLPLAYSKIGLEVTEMHGEQMLSQGYTTLVEGTAQRWYDALPDPTARKGLESLAVQCAAGIVAEGKADAKEHREDVQMLVQLAAIFGIGESSAEQPVRDFIARQVERAAHVLFAADDGAAWDRVAVQLYRKQYLSGEQVVALVAESDRPTRNS